jgi:phenylpropionate dioxygenase-like ring-hydroxylating dioxygenase large terminal subunit
MLSREENELLTRTGAGSPCGELLRRYWQPAALADELPAGGAPLPVRLLGEDLVLFRDEEGQPGLLGIHCAHRGADLSYGRIEDGGLRCLYHGWLYDAQGRCLEQPGEPTGSTFHERIRHTAYPCREVGGVILTYLGPGEAPPVPAYEFLLAPDERRCNTKIYHECNYLQGFEGTFDPQHLAFLHRVLPSDDAPRTRGPITLWEGLEAEETTWGARFVRLRHIGPDQHYVKTSNFILPNIGAFGAGDSGDGYSVHWHVPIDDTHHWQYYVHFSRTQSVDTRALREYHSVLTPDYRLTRNQGNRFLQDRNEMQTRTFAGMGPAIIVHDAYATETAGPIQDRTQEHLGFSDRLIAGMRKALLRAIRDLQVAGPAWRAPVADSARDIVVHEQAMPLSQDWRTIWQPEVAGAAAPAG